MASSGSRGRPTRCGTRCAGPPGLVSRRRGGEDVTSGGTLDAAMAEHAGTQEGTAPSDGDSFLGSLVDTSLYSMGAFFSAEHPDLTAEECFESLLTGLAVRYYNAVAA